MPQPRKQSLIQTLAIGPACVTALALGSAASAVCQQTAAPPAAPQPAHGVEKTVIMRLASDAWLEIVLKARSMLVDPASGASHFVMDPLPEPMGLLSPDGMRVAYIASDSERVKAGHDFDLFVADVDPSQPAGKANGRRLTTDQQNPANPTWLPNSGGIAFEAGESASAQVWYIDLEPNSRPVRLSDGEHRSYDLSILSDGRIAWVVHKRSEKKEQFKDLVLHSSPETRGKMRTLLTDQHISGYAFSPDGKTLAWSGMGSLFLVNLDSSESREIPLHGIHRQLMHHSAYQLAWRPDGKVIAIHCGFLGGVSRGLNADPNEPWPRMFAEDKVFFVPVSEGWTPSPESLKVGEGGTYPSPMVDDPNAEVSPPAGDQSKPWWVREIPMRPISLKWISPAEAKERMEKHPAPPDEKVE